MFRHRLEDELLICCSRVSAAPDVQTRIEKLIHESLDWNMVLERAWWHRIRPLTHHHLRSQSTGPVPYLVHEELAGHARELAERNRRLLELLNETTSLFEQSGLRALVFKGPTLAADAYGDLSLRECGDLDLLIHREDLPQVMEMLKSNQFSCLWDQADEARRRQSFSCEFRRDELELDVHWDLAPKWFNYQVDFDGLWDRGIALNELHYARKLRPEDAIVVLCIHGTKHWWERLRWICDVAEMVNRGLVTDWDRVRSTANSAKSRRCVDLGLWLAGDLLSAKLPENVRRELGKSTMLHRLSDQVGVWLSHGEQGTEMRRLKDRFLFRLRLCERTRDRLPQLAQYLWAAPSRLSFRGR